MNNSVKAGIVVAAVVVAGGLGYAVLGNKGDHKSATKDDASGQTVKLWVDNKEYKPLVEQFTKDTGIKVKFTVAESANAQADLKKDPSAAADVFMFPHDQLGQMVQAGLVYENTKYADDIKSRSIDSAVQGASYDGKLYGYPYGIETQVLYYNKAKLSADDVKTWETLTSKGKLATNFGAAGANYNFIPLFMSNGDNLYGANGEDLKGTNFNNAAGVQVLNWVAKQKSNPGVVQASDDALSKLSSGKADAFLSGPWSSVDVKKALGKNYAVAPYPTIDFGSGAKQQKAFLGVKLFGVNAQTKNALNAMKLADYLTSDKVQKKIFSELGYVPASKAVQSEASVQKDPLASTVITMSDTNHSVVMPKLPEMVTFWGPADALLNDTYKGKIAANDYQTKLDKLVSDTSKAAQ